MDLLLIEDDPVQARYLGDALGKLGWSVRHFSDAAAFFRTASDFRAQLVVLDWNLPNSSGGTVIRRIRQLFHYRIPIIVITSDLSEAVALEALGLDADDFIHKPVSADLFRARVEAVYRRHLRQRIDADELVAPPYTLRRGQQCLLMADQPVELTPREFDLAWLLFSNTVRFLSRAELMASVWGAPADLRSHTLAQHMYSLRRKLKLADHGWALKSVYGAGYRLVPPGERFKEVQNASNR